MKIRKLHYEGTSSICGWRWTLIKDDPVTGEFAVEYSTNRDGSGLWQGTQQITGTCQFFISPTATYNAAYSRIWRYFYDPNE